MRNITQKQDVIEGIRLRVHSLPPDVHALETQHNEEGHHIKIVAFLQ